jgi:hypothetical protein
MEPKDPAAICSLSADGLAERIAWIRAEILPHARARERLADGVAFEVDAAPAVVAKLDRWIALERECCAAIAFARVPSAQPGCVRLEVRGIDPDAPAFAATPF